MPRNYRFIQNIDPQEFASRFSEKEKIDLKCYEKPDLGFSFDDLRPYLEKLPLREQDLVIMYFHLNKDQAEIAKIFSISQGAVSHRLRKALKRLKFLVSLPPISLEEMLKDLTEFFYPGGPETFCCVCKTPFLGKFEICPGFKKDSKKKEVINQKTGKKVLCKSENLIYNLDVQIMMLMWITTCQSEVRDRLGLTQIKVRHKFLKNIEKLEKCAKTDSLIKKYAKGFKLISQNYNILREVKLPKWDNRQTSFLRV